MRSPAAFAKGKPLIEATDYKIHASRRDGPGIAEIHTRDTDIAYVLQGSATLVTGGTAVGVKSDRAGGAARRRDRGRRDDGARGGRRRRNSKRGPALVQGGEGPLHLLCGQGAAGEPPDLPWEPPDETSLPRLGGSNLRLCRVAAVRVFAGHRRSADAASPGRGGSPYRAREPRWSARNGATAMFRSSNTASRSGSPSLGPPNAPTTSSLTPAPSTSTTLRGRASSRPRWKTADPTDGWRSTGTGPGLPSLPAVGDFEVRGATVVFELVLDDYAEIWVDGRLPLVLGQTGGQLIKGFNAPNRVILTRDARPGQQIQLAIFGANGPISDPPGNFIWVRSATLDFFAQGTVGGDRRRRRRSCDSIRRSIGSCPAARAWRSWPEGSSSPKGRSGIPTVTSCSAIPTPTRSIAGRRTTRSRCSEPRADTADSTSAGITSPAPTV